MGCGCSQPLQVPGAVSTTGFTRDQLRALFKASVQANSGRLIVGGLLHRANSLNNNRRMYPKSILKREVDRYQQLHMKGGTALGELDHPSYLSPTFRSLNLSNISHQVLEVYWDGDSLMGVIEVLPTPSGNLLMELYREGCQVGVSSRGWASLKESPRGCITVQGDFELITFDFVSEPSTQGAFLRPLDLPYRRKLPDQSHAVALSHLAGSRAIAESEEGTSQPSATPEMVLPMKSQVKQGITALYKEHFAGGRQPPEIRHPWVAIPEGNSSSSAASTSGRSLLHQINARGSAVTGKLPPHPTKLGWTTRSNASTSGADPCGNERRLNLAAAEVRAMDPDDSSASATTVPLATDGELLDGIVGAGAQYRHPGNGKACSLDGQLPGTSTALIPAARTSATS